MLKFYFNPKGRVSLKGFWLGFILPYFAVSVVLLGLLTASVPQGAADDPQIAAGTISEALILFSPILAVLVWVSLAVIFKRLHDRGLSGWWFFAPLVLLAVANAIVRLIPILVEPVEFNGWSLPIFLPLMMIVGMGINLWLFINLYFLSGTVGSNKYGPDPRKAA